MTSLCFSLAVVCESSSHVSLAREIAGRLDVPFFLGVPLGSFDFLMAVTDERVEFRSGHQEMGPLYVDFVGGALNYRVRKQNQSKDLILRAVGGGGQRILDLTAGLASDAYVLAENKCEVTAVERSEVVSILVEDGLRRGLNNLRTEGACKRIHLKNSDALSFLESEINTTWDTVYIDPMFPKKEKTALPKKELQLLQQIVGLGDEEESRRLLSRSGRFSRRVVVKRPMSAPELLPGVSSCLEGRSIRFDIYIFS